MEFEKMTRPEIAEYLKARDFSASSMKKNELIALTKQVEVLNIPALERDDTQASHNAFR